MKFNLNLQISTCRLKFFVITLLELEIFKSCNCPGAGEISLGDVGKIDLRQTAGNGEKRLNNECLLNNAS